MYTRHRTRYSIAFFTQYEHVKKVHAWFVHYWKPCMQQTVFWMAHTFYYFRSFLFLKRVQTTISNAKKNEIISVKYIEMHTKSNLLKEIKFNACEWKFKLLKFNAIKMTMNVTIWYRKQNVKRTIYNVLMFCYVKFDWLRVKDIFSSIRFRDMEILMLLVVCGIWFFFLTLIMRPQYTCWYVWHDCSEPKKSTESSGKGK